MRNALMFSLVLTLGSGLFAQAPPAAGRGTPPPAAPPQAKPQNPAPTAPTTRKPAQAAPAGRGGMAIFVTDLRGVTIPNVVVELTGPTTRSGETNESGQLNFTMLPAGTYRLVFSGDHVTAFEREVTMKASGVQQVDITLKPAPPPKEIIKEVPAPAAPAQQAPVGPAGATQVLSLVELAEKELDRKQPRRESLVACSGNTRATLLQLNQDQPERLYQDAESMFYVIAGEGFLRVGDKETRLLAGGFASVPRATGFVLGRRGRNPLILLSMLSGEPCEQAR
jgi:mannose-6-phosphate isomerase-like protein (cupin superfamily)